MCCLQGEVFDYFVDPEQSAMVHWDTKLPDFIYTPDSFGSLFVTTCESMRLANVLGLLLQNRHHIMLVGSTGSPLNLHRKIIKSVSGPM